MPGYGGATRAARATCNSFQLWVNYHETQDDDPPCRDRRVSAGGDATASTLKARGDSEGTCAVVNFTIGDLDASECNGAFGANESNSDLDGIFDFAGWKEIVKVDAPASSGTANGVTLTLTDNGSTSGTWSVDDWGGFTTVMAILKGGPSFSAYLLDTTAGIGGKWTTEGLLTGGGPQRTVGIIGNNPRKQRDTSPGLSHMTLYSYGGATAGAVSDEITGPAPVPLPAAGWLLLAGLGGLAAPRRRKSV